MNISSILFIIFFFLAISIIPILVFEQRRKVLKLYGKSIVYLVSEMSFASEEWILIKDKIDRSDEKGVKIPIKVVFKGMFLHYFAELSILQNFGMGLFFLFVFFLFLTKIPFDFFEYFVILSFMLTWFVYYFKSFAADSSQNAIRVDKAITFLDELGWLNIDEEVLDILKDEIKTDVDYFKKAVDIGTLLLLLFTTALFLYSRMHDIFSNSTIDFLGPIIISILISKWLYESYRSRVIYIGMNAILGLKKHQYLKSKNITQ